MEIILYDCRRRRKILAKTLRLAGLGLILLSLFSLVLSTLPLLFQKTNYLWHRLVYPFRQTFTPSPVSEIDKVRKEAEAYGVNSDFSLVIPKISAAARIIPGVDPANEKEYRAALKSGVAQAVGTKLPGEGGTIYLFAHSTDSPANISRYNAVFYLLKDLAEGDQVIIFFSGKKYLYQVSQKLTTAAGETKWLTQEENEERLVLQTCWPPGTTQKRLLVIAKPLKSP